MSKKRNILTGYEGYIKASNGKWKFEGNYDSDELETCKEECGKCKPRFDRGG